MQNPLTRLARLGRATAAALALLGVGTGATLAQPRSDIVVGMAIEPAGLDPTVAAPVAIGQVVWQNVFEGLTRIDGEGRIQPQLAKSWTVSPDGLVYTFDLAENVTFSNGVPFDAGTAKFSLDRMRATDSTNPQKQFLANVVSTEARDPKTLVVTLSKPAANLLFWLAWPASVMVEPGSAATNRTQPVGTGPFKLGEWRQGDRLTLVRNETYWNAADAPKLDGATFRFIADPQAQAAALQSGDVDAFPEFGAPELYAGLETDDRFETVVGVTELKVVAGLNNRIKPLDDPRVRQALMMAVDRASLVEGAYSGYGTPIGSHYTPNDPGFRDLTAVHAYDPEKARALLAEAGYPDGFALSIKTPQMAYATRSAEILQAMLAEIGVTLTIVPTEFPAAWVDQVLTRHDFEMTIVAHAEPLDIAIYGRDNYYFGYDDAQFKAAIASAETSLDEEKRLEAYGTAQEILARDVPALFLFVMPKLGVWDARIEGLWHDEPIPANDLTSVSWRE
ncbi:ABC transporter substrate-binding protein [Antarcticirhabdus aurantiaca]|uniref:ABC transporter substrate-binding protein n=1 Tax=Antarcticirhabdus aurantiaca TaxID=2606717 RepID=A0ACD4NU39_9HYPH|nr:ABC transporter substrate-binding protein [Antarcticirhabdus aurantiaca]WAJ30390.1 ABC transporter substrate-binding protein [Jeongeuplla avenae]